MLRCREGDAVFPEHRRWRGSLGFKVGVKYVVTNRHVAPDVGMKLVDRSGGLIGSVVKTARLKPFSILDWLAYIFIGRPLPVNKVDASLIQVGEDVVVEPWLGDSARVVEPESGMKLYKRGSTTGETEGVVVDSSVSIAVDMGGYYAVFTDVYSFTNATLPGDSGGPNKTDGGVVGITFAGTSSGSLGFGIKASNIVREFGVEV